MNNLRFKQLIGWSILVLTVPLLYGMILAVGLMRGALSPSILVELPQKITNQAPRIIDESFAEAQRPGQITDPQAKAWVDAMAQVEKTPSALLQEIGLINWLETQVSPALEEYGNILKGATPPQDVMLNMEAVKTALQTESFESYASNVIGNLPECSPTEQESWLAQLSERLDLSSLPTCNPGPTISTQAIAAIQEEANSIPTEVPLTQGLSELGPSPMRVLDSVFYSALLLFTIPGILLILSVWLISNRNHIRLQVAGLTLALTALFGYATASVIKPYSQLAVNSSDAWWQYTPEQPWSADFHRFLLSEFGQIVEPAVNQLFDPVSSVAASIFALGILLYLLSLFVQRNQRLNTATQSPAVTDEKPLITPNTKRVPKKRQTATKATPTKRKKKTSSQKNQKLKD